MALSMALQSFPSAIHEKAWKKFEPKVLYTRTMMFLAARILQSMLFLIIGAETYQVSERYLTTKGETSTNELLPWATICLQILMVLRVIVFLLAFQYSCSTKVIFYLELMVQIIESLLPVDVTSAIVFLTARMMAGYTIFVATYYSFWINLFFSLLANLITYGGISNYISDEDDLLRSSFIVLIFLHILCLIMTRVLISQVAFILAEIETARDDKE